MLPSVGFRVNAAGAAWAGAVVATTLGCSQIVRLGAGYLPAPLAVRAPPGPPEMQQRVSGSGLGGRESHQGFIPSGMGSPRPLPCGAQGQEHTYLRSSHPTEAWRALEDAEGTQWHPAPMDMAQCPEGAVGRGPDRPMAAQTPGSSAG